VSDERKYLPCSDGCFVCGQENPAGLRTRFFIEGDKVKAPLYADTHHCGYETVIHGGVVAAALDECMAWAATWRMGYMTVTGELKVRYIKRSPSRTPLWVEAWVTKEGKRLAQTEARLVDEEGIEYARAEGRFVPISRDETLYVDDRLVYTGGEIRLFDGLRETV
jgi:uncharacterized protein (TIGR00369 family)